MWNSETTYAELFLKVVLISGGVSPSVRYRLYGSFFSYALTIAITFVLFGDVVGILNEANMHLRIVTLLHMVGFSMGLVLHWCIRLNGDTLLRFINNYFQPDYLGPQAISCTETGFKKVSSVLIVVYWIFHLNFVASTFSHGIISGIQDPKALLLPTFYKCSAESKNSTAYWISSLCWNIDTFRMYLIVNSFTSVIYLTLLIPYGTTFLFYFFAIIYINVNLDVFKRRVSVLSENLFNKRFNQLLQQEGLIPVNTDTLTHDQMLEIQLHYRKLRKALTDISPLLSYLATCNLVIFAIMVCSLLIVILKVPSIGENIVFLLEYAAHVMIFFMYFALSCFGGETLRNMNMEAANTIYDLPWYNQSVRFQKSVYMFLMLLTIKPLEVNSFQMTIQLRICMVFLQRMYSVLNLILTQMRV